MDWLCERRGQSRLLGIKNIQCYFVLYGLRIGESSPEIHGKHLKICIFTSCFTLHIKYWYP
jgi:hypothetical protein